jgi:hypothetical protein
VAGNGVICPKTGSTGGHSRIWLKVRSATPGVSMARRFDRSVSWVSRRLALVEVLPEAIQQQVREGQIPAQVALKFLVPVARVSLEDCQRMAAIFAQHHCDTRAAGQLYAGSNVGSPVPHSWDRRITSIRRSSQHSTSGRHPIARNRISVHNPLGPVNSSV